MNGAFSLNSFTNMPAFSSSVYVSSVFAHTSAVQGFSTGTALDVTIADDMFEDMQVLSLLIYKMMFV
jgi:hypothetical protein